MPPASDLQQQLLSDPAYTHQETVVPYGALSEPEYKLILSIFMKQLTSKELITSKELLPEAVPTGRASGWTWSKPGGSKHNPWLWRHQEWAAIASEVQRKGFKVTPVFLGQTFKCVLKPSPEKVILKSQLKGLAGNAGVLSAWLMGYNQSRIYKLNTPEEPPQQTKERR